MNLNKHKVDTQLRNELDHELKMTSWHALRKRPEELYKRSSSRPIDRDDRPTTRFESFHLPAARSCQQNNIGFAGTTRGQLYNFAYKNELSGTWG